MKNRNIEHSDNWATPKWLYDCLNEEFKFEYDPCPLFSPFDGLAFDWEGSNFINPPYSRQLKEAFVKKAVYESKYNGRLCVMLLPVSTSTRLFHEWILPYKSGLRFLERRVKFVGVNTKGEMVSDKSPMHDSMIVVFGGAMIFKRG